MELFLSTPSARRATWCGAVRGWLRATISIHALREEGDRLKINPFARKSYFYPRPPRGGRQKTPRLWYTRGDISIHALREEGDLGATIDRLHRAIFLSTPSARRATTEDSIHADGVAISIHALREEGDRVGLWSGPAV